MLFRDNISMKDYEILLIDSYIIWNTSGLRLL